MEEATNGVEAEGKASTCSAQEAEAYQTQFDFPEDITFQA